jgi:hypothetical protein
MPGTGGLDVRRVSPTVPDVDSATMRRRVARLGGRVAPRRRNGDYAVIPGVRIEAEKTGVAADEPLPFVRPSDACFRQPALCQSLTKSKSCAGAEIELVRVPHPDAALKRLVQFRQEVRPSRLTSWQT